MKKHIIVFCLLFGLGTSAQENYEVFYIKGNVSLSDKGAIKEVHRGLKFTSGTLSLEDNAMIVIMTQSGRNLRIADEGVYGTKEISKLYKKTDGDITSEYFRYVWAEMKDTDEDTDVAKVKGSVYRGDILMYFA